MATVVLPNGLEIEGVPEGTGKRVLLDKLRKKNVITAEEFAEWSGKAPSPAAQAAASNPLEMLQQFNGPAIGGPAPAGAPDPSQPTEQQAPMTVPQMASGAGEFLQENMDLPGGVAGALAGAKMGAPAGPMGAAGGAIAGGAVGTFGGELLSDWLVGDEMDFGEATKQALINGGIDAATLGAVKAFKVGARTLGFGPEEMAELWAKYADPQALPVGSQDSLRQTQKMLTDEGGTMTAYQTGQSSATNNIMEGVAEIGVVSGSRYKDTAAKNADIIASKLQEMIDVSAQQVSGTNIGETIHGVIEGGKKAAQKLYKEGMEELTIRSGRTPIEPKWIAGGIRKFLQDNSAAYGSTLDPATLKLAEGWMKTLDEVPTMSLKDMLKFQKQLNNQVSQLGEFGLTQNTVASRELADLSTRVRDITEAMLKNADPEAYAIYKATNEAYGEAMEGLLPQLNANVIKRADKGDFESIARVLEGKNPDQIKAFMNSLDTAYNQAGIAGIEGIPLSINEAKDAIRSGWLKNLFGEQVKEGFDMKRFSRLADYYEKPANARAAKEILGEQFPQFKRLVNAMAELSNKQSGFVGSLVLRSKEAQAAQYVASGAAFTSGAGAPGAAAILFGPVMLAKIASSPKAVNRLLAGNAKAATAINAGKLASVNDILVETMESIMGNLSEEDQAEIRQEIR